MSRKNFLTLSYRFSEAACSIEDMELMENMSVESVSALMIDPSDALMMVGDLFRFGWNHLESVDVAACEEALESAKDAYEDELGDNVESSDLFAVMHTALEYGDGATAKISRILKRAPKVTPEDKLKKLMQEHKPYVTLKTKAEYKMLWGTSSEGGYAATHEFLEWRYNKKQKRYNPHIVGYRVIRMVDKLPKDGSYDVAVRADESLQIQSCNVIDYFRLIDSSIHYGMERNLPKNGYHRIAIGTIGAHIVSSGIA